MEKAWGEVAALDLGPSESPTREVHMFHCKSSGGADEQVHFHILHHMHHTRLRRVALPSSWRKRARSWFPSGEETGRGEARSAFAGPILTPLGLKRAHRGAYARYTAIAEVGQLREPTTSCFSLGTVAI